jgi:hypothetical protein
MSKTKSLSLEILDKLPKLPIAEARELQRIINALVSKRMQKHSWTKGDEVTFSTLHRGEVLEVSEDSFLVQTAQGQKVISRDEILTSY